MKAIITVLLLPALLCGCRLYTVTQGDGYVYTDNGNFLCANNSGDCVQQYDSPTTETLQALPSPDYAFRRWEGCHYDSLTSCEADINQRAVDEDMEWTVTAVFEKKRPDIEPAQYTYNALGQRITKTVGGVTTVFQYDLDGKLIAELDANGHPLRQHAYLEGAPIAMIERKTAESDPEVYYVHTDHLAKPDLITDDQGRIVADFEKTPFGVPYVNYSEIDYNLGFPGQYYDTENGLHYNYYRNYDANTGRYIQSDPIGLEGGINTYAYANQNPLRYIDPEGKNPLVCFAWPWGTAACAVAAVGVASSVKQCSDGVKHASESKNHLEDSLKKKEQVFDCLNTSSCSMEDAQQTLSDADLLAQQAIREAANAAFDLGSSTPGTSASGPLPTSIGDLAGSAVTNAVTSLPNDK